MHEHVPISRGSRGTSIDPEPWLAEKEPPLAPSSQILPTTLPDPLCLHTRAAGIAPMPLPAWPTPAHLSSTPASIASFTRQSRSLPV